MIACHSLISRTAPFPSPVATLLLSIVPGGGSRSGVSIARVVECLDLRREGLTLLVLGHERQLALRVLWYGHDNHAEVQRAREAIQAARPSRVMSIAR